MKTISIIQPDEFGEDFKYEGGIWKVKFPPGKPNINPVSKDAGNAVTTGTDGGAYLSEAMLCAYALVQDNATKKIHLYQFPVGTVFNVLTATLVSTVNMVDLQAVFDDVAIEGTVLKFTDADSGQTMTIDTDTLQRVSAIAGSENLTVATLNGNITPTININFSEANILSVSGAGLLVDGSVVGEAVDGIIAEGGFNDATHRFDEELGVMRSNVNNNELQIPQIAIKNSKGELVGLMDDLTAGESVYSTVSPLDYSPWATT